ncbi:hypothetical protein [Bradyrhizobium sp. JR3.5]
MTRATEDRVIAAAGEDRRIAGVVDEDLIVAGAGRDQHRGAAVDRQRHVAVGGLDDRLQVGVSVNSVIGVGFDENVGSRIRVGDPGTHLHRNLRSVVRAGESDPCVDQIVKNLLLGRVIDRGVDRVFEVSLVEIVSRHRCSPCLGYEDSSRSPPLKLLIHNWFVATQLKCGHRLRTC